jgi:uncharacterized protein
VIQHLRPSDYRQQRWKNGGGTTSEIAADAENDPPAWRISVATIDRDGAFSDFRGYDRTIVALEGGVRLSVDGTETDLQPFEPFTFRGESSVHAHVAAGPARDLNAMTLRAQYAHDVEIVQSAQRFLVDDDELLFAYVLRGTATVDATRCREGETVYLDSVERFDVTPETPDSRVCVIHVTPR